jgi:hypothetical protein
MPLRGPLWALGQAYRLVAVGMTVCRTCKMGIEPTNYEAINGLEELSNLDSSGADCFLHRFPEHDGQR